MNLDLFKGKKILVYGDFMLDKYIHGKADRICPEAPVPVIRILFEDYVLGGAGNTANNIISLGGKVFACGVIGKDNEGKKLLELLKKSNIDTTCIMEDPTRITTLKKRVVSGNNQLLLRLDYEQTNNITEEQENKIIEKTKNILKEVDAVIISDYAKGSVTEKIVKEFIQSKKLIIADIKPKNFKFFKGVFLITPNLKEAIEISGEEQNIEEMGKKIVDMLDCNVFITRGSEGISVFDKNKKHIYVPSLKVSKVFDVTGAGDTVVAVSALSLSSCFNLEETAKISNYAAGIVVQKPGTSTLTLDELKSAFQDEVNHYIKESIEVKQKMLQTQSDKIEKAAKLFIETYKKGNKVIAFGNGGSASDAQHLVGELVGRFKIERKALPAIALTTDSSVVTAISNDYGYEHVFERQIEANANPNDLVFGISTSGNSQNVINAIKKAKEIGCKTIGLTGKEGGLLAKLCDIAIIVPSDNTPRIQESHIAVIHIICEILDKSIHKENIKK